MPGKGDSLIVRESTKTNCMEKVIGRVFIVSVSPSAKIDVWRYWFRLSHLYMMVIGSFASYTKTKSVESAV
jgi:hypothetical protein